MAAIAVRNLWERKLRTVLTSLAIVLGVMMVAGTYVLTDTIDRSFERIFTQSNEGVDAVVTSKQNIETFDDAGARVSGLGPEAGRGGRRRRRGRGLDRRPAGLDHRRRRRSPRRQRGAEPRLLGQRPLQRPLRPAHLRRGRPADEPDQVVIDKASAEDEGFEVGDTIDDRRPRRHRRLHAQRDRHARRRRLVRRRDDRRPHPARGPAR